MTAPTAIEQAVEWVETAPHKPGCSKALASSPETYALMSCDCGRDALLARLKSLRAEEWYGLDDPRCDVVFRDRRDAEDVSGPRDRVVPVLVLEGSQDET